ncbi:MAG: hypothetical protein R2729_18840 [Bryobacteraceae bacterium]
MSTRQMAVLAALVIAGPVLAGVLRAGKASVKLAVPPGARIAGAHTPRTATGTLDELRVKALVFEIGMQRAALIACDVHSMDDSLAAAARRAVTEATGLQPEQVMISATNTHSGPDADALRTILPAKAAEAAAQAARGLGPATVRYAVGREESVCHYRRYLMKDGTVQVDPGKENPETVQPMGETDADLPVVFFDPAVLYINYAMRPEAVRGSRYSADYPAALARVAGKVFGAATLPMFTAGAEANVNHIDVKSAAPQKGAAEALRIGTILAGEAIKASARFESFEPAAIRLARETVRLPARKGGVEAEVQVLALDDRVAWVGLPGDVYVELGRAIKKASPYPLTIVVGHANGSAGLASTAKAYKEGGEDVEKSRLAPGAGEALAEAAIRLLAAAHRASR